MSFVLVLYIFAGMLSKGDSVALTTVRGFDTREACVAAGEQSKGLVSGSFKDARYVCLPIAKKRNGD